MPRASRRHPLIWLSGASTRHRHARLRVVGALILAGSVVTAGLAAYGSVTVLELPIAAAVAAGAAAGVLVVVLDRFLSVEGRAGGAGRAAVFAVLRVACAGAMAGALSVPVVLEIYRPDVDRAIAAEQRQARIRALAAEVDRLRQTAGTSGEVAAERDADVVRARAELESAQAAFDRARAAWECEMTGDSCESGSGKTGQAPVVRRLYAELQQQRKRRDEAQSRLDQVLATARVRADSRRETAERAAYRREVELTSLRAADDIELRPVLAPPPTTTRLAALGDLARTRDDVAWVWSGVWLLLTVLGLLPVLARSLLLPRPAVAGPAGGGLGARLRQLLMAVAGGSAAPPPARARVVEAPARTSRPRPPAPPPAAAPAGDDDGLERFLVGEVPTRVRAGDDFSLVARIVVDRPDPDGSAAPMRGFAVGPDGVEVVLLVHVDSGLAGTERLETTVRVPHRRGTEPVRFPLRALRAGLRRIRLSAWLGGTRLAEVELEVSAEDRRVDGSNQRRTAPIAALRGTAGEVTLQVGFDGARYFFQLISSRYVSEQVVASSLTEAPEAAVERTVAMLRRFAEPGTSTARRWIEETGVGLWNDLVPDPIKEAFWELRGDIGAFTIACADDRVPWELLYPVSATEDHGFLTQQFPVVRRVIGQHLSPEISLGDARFVVPPAAPAHARAEVDRLRAVLGGPPGEPITHVDRLLEVIDGDAAGLLHFACHDAFGQAGGGPSISMDGGPFVPVLLNRAVTRRALAARHPLVFVNASHRAGAAPACTRMMGLAGQFMKAGAGAFVGTLWPVDSDRAAAFAEVFYAELGAGTPLGRAAMRARSATEAGADPTWLAYAAYGDAAATAGR